RNLNRENEYDKTNRGCKGYLVSKMAEETGHVAAVEVGEGTEDMMPISIHGVLIRIPVDCISITRRNTQGVRLIRLQDDEEVATVTQVVEDDPEVTEDLESEDTEDSAETEETNDQDQEDNDPS